MELIEAMKSRLQGPDGTIEEAAADMIAKERADYHATYARLVRNLLTVTPGSGRFPYA